MQTLTIEAVTRESARDLHLVLSAFGARVCETQDGPCRVEVTLGRSDREIVELLNAIEQYVTERQAGAAHIRLDEHRYTLHPTPSA